MSANIVDLIDINYIVNYIVIKDRFKDYHANNKTPDELGQILVNENYRSVNFRYRETTQPEVFKYRPVLSETIYWTDSYNSVENLELGEINHVSALDPIFILRLINYYDYQSCETDDWPKTDAYYLIQGIKEKCISELTEGMPWGTYKSAKLEARYKKLHREKIESQLKRGAE